MVLAVLPVMGQLGQEKPHFSPQNGYGLQFMNLSAPQEQAFLAHAQEKANDFFAYLNLAADPALDPEMRKQSADLALSMFSTIEAPLSSVGIAQIPSHLSTVAELLAYLLGLKNEAITFDLSTVNGEKGTPAPTVMRISIHSIGNIGNPANLDEKNLGGAEFLTEYRMVNKQFGKSSETVWEVSFVSLSIHANP